jgi:hybrid cluster-associated redox disulfide protein
MSEATEFVSKDMLIGDIIRSFPPAAYALMACGMGCVHCGAAQGETLEQAVHREVMEETGLKVRNIRYYKSQPWGIVDDLLVGFFCDVDGDDTIKMDEGELKIAEWRTRSDVELQPDQFSLTNEMMTVFKEGRLTI